MPNVENDDARFATPFASRSGNSVQSVECLSVIEMIGAGGGSRTRTLLQGRILSRSESKTNYHRFGAEA